MAAYVEVHLDESSIGPTTVLLHPREFKSGSTGYFATAKVETGDPAVRFQATLTLVRIGSKPTSK
jgi:hypothetical protein